VSLPRHRFSNNPQLTFFCSFQVMVLLMYLDRGSLACFSRFQLCCQPKFKRAKNAHQPLPSTVLSKATIMSLPFFKGCMNKGDMNFDLQCRTSRIPAKGRLAGPCVTLALLEGCFSCSGTAFLRRRSGPPVSPPFLSPLLLFSDSLSFQTSLDTF